MICPEERWGNNDAGHKPGSDTAVLHSVFTLLMRYGEREVDRLDVPATTRGRSRDEGYFFDPPSGAVVLDEQLEMHRANATAIVTGIRTICRLAWTGVWFT